MNLKCIVFLLLLTADKADQKAVIEKWKKDFGDVAVVSTTHLGKEKKTIMPSQEYCRIVVFPAQLEALGRSTNNLSKAKYDKWRNTPGTLKNSDCTQAIEATFTTWETVLKNDGYSPVVSVSP